MARQRKITVRGKQRPDIDPQLLLQVLLAIAAEWDQPAAGGMSPDSFESAVEDHHVQEQAG